MRARARVQCSSFAAMYMCNVCSVFATCKEANFARMEKLAPFAAATSFKQYREALWGHYADNELGWLATVVGIAKAPFAPSFFVVGHTPPQTKYVEDPNYKPLVAPGDEHWKADVRLVPGEALHVPKDGNSEVRNHIRMHARRERPHARTPTTFILCFVSGVSVQHLRDWPGSQGHGNVYSFFFRVCDGLCSWAATIPSRLILYYRACGHSAVFKLFQHHPPPEPPVSGAPESLHLLRLSPRR